MLLAAGSGTYNDSVLASGNLINPTRRDVVTMPAPNLGDPGGFIVIAFPLDNPGIWVTRSIKRGADGSCIVI